MMKRWWVHYLLPSFKCFDGVCCLAVFGLEEQVKRTHKNGVFYITMSETACLLTFHWKTAPFEFVYLLEPSENVETIFYSFINSEIAVRYACNMFKWPAVSSIFWPSASFSRPILLSDVFNCTPLFNTAPSRQWFWPHRRNLGCRS